MSEFVFRNLSVKLFPEVAANAGQVCECCSYVVHCDDCSLCTEGPTTPPACEPCTENPASDCGQCSTGATDFPCGGASDCGPSCGDTGACFPCTEFGTIPCRDGTVNCEFDSFGQGTGCLDTITIFLPGDEGEVVAGGEVAQPAIEPRSLDVVQRELAMLRAELRAAMARHRAEGPALGAPAGVDEMDRLRGALLEAVEELDERRGTGGPETAG